MKKKLVVLTGAGISAESGLKTFRDSDGLWEGHDVTEVATPEAWRRNKELVLEFYNQRRKQAMEANPDLIVEVVGHTDNVGNANDNYLVALKYARQLRWYLVNKGNLDRKKIIAKSEGESKAIASNKTERGRLLNRRIEIKYSSS